ncbi:hypothetical protein Tco_1280701 [Tanacetum coccineum]
MLSDLMGTMHFINQNDILAMLSNSVGAIALGWLLEEIYVTWAHLEKKRTRLCLYTKSLEEYAYNTPLVSPFLDSDDASDDSEVLSDLEEYGNAWKLCRKKVINNIDGDDLAF